MKARKTISKDGIRAIRVEGPMNVLQKDTIRKIKGAKYYANINQRFWVCPLRIENIRLLKNVKSEICPALKDTLITFYKKGAQIQVEPIGPIKGLKGQLMPFQEEGVAILEQWSGRALLADDMGLGKTIQCIAWLQLHRNISPVLIVCPASVKLNWEIEMNKWMLPKPNIQILSGKTPHALHGQYIIINYDILDSWKKQLKKYKFACIITDECHRWKNSNASRTKVVKSLIRKAPHVICVSGTPFENNPIELYNVLHSLTPTKYPTKLEFGLKYCQGKSDRGRWVFEGVSDVEELNYDLRKHIMIRRLKKDVLAELPAKQYVTIPLQINMKAYNEASANFIQWLSNEIDKKNEELEEKIRQSIMSKHKNAAISGELLDRRVLEEEKQIRLESVQNAETLAKMEALKQIAAKEKLPQIIDWISDFLESGEKLTVFCTHTFVIEALMNKFGKVAVKIDGSVNPSHRPAIIKQFQTDKRTKLFFGNITACGEGITLTAASKVAVIEYPWTPAKLNQVIDRVHRITQKEQVTVYYFPARNTIEEDIVRILHIKQMFLDGVLDGKDIPQESVMKQLLRKMKIKV